MLQQKPPQLAYSTVRVPAPEHPDNIALLAYVTGRRGAEPVIAREAFEPLDVARQLPGIFMAEPEDGDFRYRLVGSAIEQRMKRVLTGALVSEIYGAETLALYHEIASGTEPVIMQGNFTGDDLMHIRFEAMNLPMRFAGGRIGVFGGQFAFN